MKKTPLYLFALLFIGCNTNDASIEKEYDLVGKWKIIEQLMDPGDGSGTFQPIISDRIVEFFSNGKVTANGELCYISSEVGDNHFGTYVKIDGSKFNDGEILPEDCIWPETKLYYKLEGDKLIIWYQCIEGCGQKFVKVK